MSDFKGFCKECGFIVLEKDKIPEYEVYECSNCCHPHSLDELWEEVPCYISGIE